MKEVKEPVLPLLVSLLAASLAHGTPRLARREVCDGEKCFLLFPQALNFTSARDECVAEKGELATFPSADDQRKSLSLVNVTSGRFWIGLTLPADVRCPARDSDMYGYKWINGDAAAAAAAAAARVSGWAGFPDRCDHRCVSVSTNGSWQQEPCGGTLDGFFCAARADWCPAGVRLAEPGAHDASTGNTHAPWLPPAAEWTTRGEEEDSYFHSKWLCAFGLWFKAPWKCEVIKGGCAHTCLNNTCTCPAGQVLHANNVTCVDADECHDGKGCARENTQCQREPGGGFKCVCLDGYDEEDGVCVDVSICDTCEHLLCVKAAGVYSCACRNGFIVSKVHPTRCDPHCDQQECPAKCEENPAKPGHYQCPCPVGYIHEIKNNASLCTEVDECENESPCDHECVNTRGSYTCLCREGFVIYDEDECVPEGDDYRAATNPPVLHTPSSTTAGVPFYVRAGSVLGISVFVAVGVALLYLLLRYSLTHCRGTFEVTSLRRADMDVLTLQQVTTEKYQRFSFDKQSRADCQRL